MSRQDQRPTPRGGRNRATNNSRSYRTTRSTRGSSYDESPRVTSRGEVRPAAGPGPSKGPVVIMAMLFFALVVVAFVLSICKLLRLGDLVNKMESARSGAVCYYAKRGTIRSHGNVLALR